MFAACVRYTFEAPFKASKRRRRGLGRRVLKSDMTMATEEEEEEKRSIWMQSLCSLRRGEGHSPKLVQNEKGTNWEAPLLAKLRPDSRHCRQPSPVAEENQLYFHSPILKGEERERENKIRSNQFKKGGKRRVVEKDYIFASFSSPPPPSLLFQAIKSYWSKKEEEEGMVDRFPPVNICEKSLYQKRRKGKVEVGRFQSTSSLLSSLAKKSFILLKASFFSPPLKSSWKIKS